MIQEMHERLKKANERRNCGADDEITRLRAALAAKDAEVERLRKANGLLEGLNVPLHAGPDGCPHYYDGCHCLSVENDRLIKEIERLRADAALGRAVRRLESAGLWSDVYGWFVLNEGLPGCGKRRSSHGNTPEAALRAAGLMEEEK